MKIILTDNQLKGLSKKLNTSGINESLEFQKRICDATFGCFIKGKYEQKKYVQKLIEDNLKSIGYPKKKILEYSKKNLNNLILENEENIKIFTDSQFKNFKNFILEELEDQKTEQIDIKTNPQYDFKLYFESGEKKYAWRLKNTEQWYEAEGELFKLIEKKIPFNSTPSSTQQTLSDDQVAEKIKKTGFDRFFAGLRNALNSPMGALVQKFLSLTGIGAIATTVAWGALTIYDAYMAISGRGSWMLLLIDIFALLSNGYLTKFLQPLKNVMSSGISQAVESIKKMPKIYNTVKKFLPKAIEKFANVNKLISQGDSWAKKKLKADMSKGKDAIQQAQTELEAISQSETQVTTTGQTETQVTTTGQTTNENYFYTTKKKLKYKSIYY
jgi:hypothetical protein